MLEILKKIFNLANFKKKSLYVLFLCILISAFLETLSVALILPIIIFITKPDLVDEYFFSSFLVDLGYSQYQIILIIVFFFFLIFFIKFLYLTWLAWYKSGIIYSYELKLSKKILAFNLQKDFSYYDNTNSSKLLNLAINQCSIFSEYGVKPIFNLVSDLMVVIGILLMLFYFEPLITLISLLFIGSSFYFIVNFTKSRSQKWSEEKLKFESNRIRQLNEILGLIKNIKLGSFEKKFFDEFNEFSTRSTNASKNQFFLTSIPRLFVEFSGIALFTLIIFLMYSFNSLNLNLLPKLALMASAAFRILPALGVIQSCVVNIRFVRPVIKEIETLFRGNNFSKNQLEIDKNIDGDAYFDDSLQISNDKKNMLFNKDLIIKNMSFYYKSKNDLVFENINLSIKFGEIIGIIGKSGSGKSTLINLITGILQPQEGDILTDGIKISSNLKNWQKNIGYVPQGIFLLDRSIKENIAFGDKNEEVDLNKISKVIRLSNLNSYIIKSKNGIDSSVGEKGSLISGGQIQRIGIARGLYYNPRLLILDESTNALDSETEKEILNELKKLKNKVTLLIISHKMKTLEICDKIYRVDNKKIKQEI